jgi:hypothetical protein
MQTAALFAGKAGDHCALLHLLYHWLKVPYMAETKAAGDGEIVIQSWLYGLTAQAAPAAAAAAAAAA